MDNGWFTCLGLTMRLRVLDGRVGLIPAGGTLVTLSPPPPPDCCPVWTPLWGLTFCEFSLLPGTNKLDFPDVCVTFWGFCPNVVVTLCALMVALSPFNDLCAEVSTTDFALHSPVAFTTFDAFTSFLVSFKSVVLLSELFLCLSNRVFTLYSSLLEFSISLSEGIVNFFPAMVALFSVHYQ